MGTGRARRVSTRGGRSDRSRDDRHRSTDIAVTTEKEIPPLDQEATAKLTEFARACKAAARAVTLYPPAHPAIRMSLARLVDTAGRLTATGPVTFGVLPDNLLLDGSSAAKPDQAVRETGAL